MILIQIRLEITFLIRCPLPLTIEMIVTIKSTTNPRKNILSFPDQLFNLENIEISIKERKEIISSWMNYIENKLIIEESILLKKEILLFKDYNDKKNG